jgi:tripartite-type tricarboxylate transporter receptor subunit TctC
MARLSHTRHAKGCVLVACVAVSTAIGSQGASAQNWPSRPVHLVVPFVPGGATDVIARLVAEGLTRRLGQPAVIDNKPGAGGNIGATHVAKSAPDGHTMFVAGSPGFPNAAALSKDPGFDPEKDFAPVALLGTQGMLLTVNATVSATSAKDLVSYAKANPGKLSYASPGIGTPHHLAMEYLKQVAGIDLVHVPYRGGAPMTQATVAGEVAAMFGSFVIVGNHIKTGKLRALGSSGKKRLTQAPDVPSLAEQGYPNFDVENWFGIVSPAKTPTAVVERMHREVQEVLEQEELRKRLLTIGFDPPPKMTSAALGEWIKRDVKQWGGVLKQAGFKPE